MGLRPRLRLKPRFTQQHRLLCSELVWASRGAQLRRGQIPDVIRKVKGRPHKSAKYLKHVQRESRVSDVTKNFSMLNENLGL